MGEGRAGPHARAAGQDQQGLSVIDDVSFAVREPQQARTREQWARILDQGLALLEDVGYDGFTIAALCERAGVPPRALYARADTKDALFLAVYEHGMLRVQASEAPFDDLDRWAALSYAERVDAAVALLTEVFAENERFLRAVVLISGAHPEVLRRGLAYQRRVRDRFVLALGGSEPIRESFCFGVVFSTLVTATAYAEFGTAALAELQLMARRYLDA